ncbi:MAG: 1-deoxy-D-xylulose-5-phosphate synthase [Chloroflexota bacterium]
MSPVTKPGVDEGVALRAVGADSLLARLEGPEGLKGLSGAELNQIAEQLRTAIIATTAVTGGHLGPSLGVVELTIALHHVMSSPVDRIVFDTGHQAEACVNSAELVASHGEQNRRMTSLMVAMRGRASLLGKALRWHEMCAAGVRRSRWLWATPR